MAIISRDFPGLVLISKIKVLSAFTLLYTPSGLLSVAFVLFLYQTLWTLKTSLLSGDLQELNPNLDLTLNLPNKCQLTEELSQS